MPIRLTIFIVLLTLAGCNKAATPAVTAAKPVEVIVDRPTVEMITDTEEFPGRLEAVETVVVRSRVTGHLNDVYFADGADVPKGKLLFEIDPLSYQAEVERCEAAVSQALAKRDRLKKDFDRIQGASAGVLSTEEKDRIVGDLAEADAAVKAATAAVKYARTNLDYTKITAKIAGRIGRRLVDPGNLVKADETILATIVALDQLYASFDIDERTLLRLRRLGPEGVIVGKGQDRIEVGIALSDETGFPRTGIVDFDDNQVNPRTGTIRVRARLANTNKLLSPGLYVRVRFPVGKPHRAILIPEEAVASDQGQKYVFLVNDRNEVVYRKVTLGAQSGRNRVVESGLSTSDLVIVNGLQRVRPGAKVTPKTAERPSADAGTSPPAQAVAAGGR